MGRLIIVTTQYWEEARWMYSQVSSAASSPGKVPFSLLGGNWWCWMCQDSSMQRVWVWVWIVLSKFRHCEWGMAYLYSQNAEKIGPSLRLAQNISPTKFFPNMV